MEPTLKNKSIVFIRKYNIEPKYNDILVINKDNKIIIKRLVGLPNDMIFIDKYIYINGEKLDEIEENSDNINKEILLKENEYFVIGDNRQNSIDSRFDEIGIINKNEIIGIVIGK